jgi:rod shape-determining protein MreC
MLHHIRNANLVALAVLLVIGMVMGVQHNRALENGDSYWAEDIIRVPIKPLQVAVAGIGGVFQGIGRSLHTRSALQKENKRLQEEVKRLNTEVARLREEAGEAKRLRTILGFKEQSGERHLPVKIISRNPSEWFITATIDRGRTSGIQPGQAVVTHWGFVGQVFEVSPTSAQIRRFPRESGVGAIVQRSRALGICQGEEGNPDLYHLTYLGKDTDIKAGDIIVTSGQGGIIPKGIPLGRVIKVRTDSGGFTKSASIRPSVSFDRVEEALVVLRKVD